MKKILYIILFSLITLTIFSCAGEEPFYSDPFTDTTAPFIEEVTFVTTPTNDSTPDYTFSSDEAGTITYGGSCSSSTTSAVEGNNTITLVSLNEGTYSDCTITVTDEAGNISIKLTITSFILDTTVPVISGGTITTPPNDSTPNYTFSSDEAGTITYGGSCSSANKSAISGNNIITLNSLSDGTYSNCTLTVTDSAGNSVTLNITSFTVAIPPTIEEVTFVTTPTNDSTPDYTFSSDEAGTITYGGSCSSTTTSAIVGNNTITLVSLNEETYSDCTITVTDSAGNASSALSVSTFVVDTTAPSVSSFTLSDTALITGDTATVTLVFSEAVASFSSAADITVANGTLATMSSADNITWAGTFTPTANTEDASNTLSLATSYTDTAGNAGYVEDFVDKNCDAGIALNSSCTNWEGSEASTHSGSGIYVGPHVNLQPAGYDTPDGDDYYVQNYTGQSISKFAITKAGENTITGPVDLTCDWASSTNLGMRILAEVGGVWYGSTQIGTGSNDHGAMDQDKVTDWEVNVSINTATGTWYQATGLPNGYDWRDGNRFSTTPLTGLPAGDITRFGIGWLHTANHHYGAVDNFRPLATTLNYAVETLAPTVYSVSTTADNQSLISITDNITVTFSEAMGTSYITTTTSDTTCRAETIKVSSDNFSTCVRMSSEPVSSNDNKKYTLDPYYNLTAGTTYKTRVTTGVKDTAGNALSSQYDNSTGFTTSSASASSATAISLGSFHTCMLDNGSVKCWGRNNYGQLGIDNTTDMGDGAGEMALIPTVNLGTGRTATAISAGYGHTCAILDNASVKCWGRNNQAQLGIDNTTNMGDGSGEMAALPSIDLGTGRTATAIATGNYHTCALLDNASVKCWGNGGYGQLGLDNNTKMGDAAGEMAALPSIDLGTGRTATAIATGYYHSCALLDDGSVKCWGFNAKGQLGIDNTTNMGTSQGDMAQLTGINLGTGRTATAIGAAVNNTCALLDNASVKCWGDNYYGQLGINNETTMGDGSGEMAQLSGINLGTGRTATAISVGYYHSCALLDNASVKCWGKNGNGQLGLESTTYMGNGTGEMAQLTGINLGTDRTATAISAGMEHSCALLDNASVKCWGDNDYGQLGIDNTTTMGDGSGEMDLLLGIDL